jgi:hypothetical protein
MNYLCTFHNVLIARWKMICVVCKSRGRLSYTEPRT